MNISRDNAPQLLLRLGLAITFLYATIAAFITPSDWVGYLPSMLTSHIDAKTVLYFFDAFQLVLVILLVSGIYVRWAAWLTALTILGIITSNYHLFIITFRDFGLFFMAVALALMPESE